MDNGFFMTLDNWHNMGYGKVIALYTPEGKAIRSYELSDLFSKIEIEALEHSKSSIRWLKAPGAYVRPGGDTFNITINATGAAFILEQTVLTNVVKLREEPCCAGWRIRAGRGARFASPTTALVEFQPEND
jgi:hypothetical protein